MHYTRGYLISESLDAIELAHAVSFHFKARAPLAFAELVATAYGLHLHPTVVRLSNTNLKVIKKREGS